MLGCGVLCCLVPGSGHAQLITLVPRAGEVGGYFLGTWRGSGDEFLGMDGVSRQWLRLPFRGSVVDSRLLAYDVSLRPAFTQRVSPGLPSSIGSREFGLDMGARLLTNQPVSFSLTTSRSSGSTSGGFGTRGDFTTSSRNAIVMVRWPALPTRLHYAIRSYDNTFSSTERVAPVTLSNSTRTLRLTATNSKVNLLVERVQFEDRLDDQSFSLSNLSFTHRFRWGRGSRLETAIDRTTREGESPYLRRSWSERVHLQHSSATSSDLRYQQQRSATGGADANRRSVSYALRARIGAHVTTGLAAARLWTRYDGGRQELTSAAPNLRVTLPLPLNIRLTAGGRAGLEHRVRHRNSNGVLSVVNERHAVDESRSVLLEQAGVDASTVTVRSGDETVVYAIGVDYELVPLDGLVELIIPATSRIQVGETILVSYQYLPAEESSGTVTTSQLSLSLARKGVRLLHERSLRHRPTDGTPGTAFGTFNENRTAVTMSTSSPVGRWDLDLRRTVRESDAFAYTTDEANATLALPSRPNLQTFAGFAARRTTSEERRLSSRAVHATATWIVGHPLQLTTRVQWWDIDVTDGNAERAIAVNLNATIRLAAIEAFVQARYDRRTVQIPINTSGVSVRVVRRF